MGIIRRVDTMKNAMAGCPIEFYGGPKDGSESKLTTADEPNRLIVLHGLVHRYERTDRWLHGRLVFRFVRTISPGMDADE